jgi:hypothetical protein
MYGLHALFAPQLPFEPVTMMFPIVPTRVAERVYGPCSGFEPKIPFPADEYNA